MRKNRYKALFHKLLVVTTLFFVSAQNANSQENMGTVRGNVSDENGFLPSASIRVSGTANGTTSDAKGNYSLKLAPGTYTLTSSYVGYATVTKKDVTIVGGKETVVIFKMQGATDLKEVVVSYGKQKSREVTGSIVTISAQGLDDMPVNQFAQQLQGKAAGVQVLQSSGQPGRGIEFRIRGAASFNASNQPLFVVDGMPVTGSINNINPSEIESYSILKDASATALYGSRASNGVVLITTKHAKAGDSKIEFNSNYGVQKIPTGKLPRPMNAREFATFMKERWDDGLRYNSAYTVAADYAAAYTDPSQYGEGTNWFKLLTRTAPIQNYDLTIQTARENSSSTIVAGYQEQQGVVINTGTKLFSLRFNQDISLINNKLKIGFNVAPSYRLDHNNRLATDGVGGLFERLFEASPLVAPFDADGNYIRNVSSPGMVAYINPLATLNLTKDDYKTTRILGNAYVNYEILSGLMFKANIGVDKGTETNDYFQSGQVTGTANNPTGTSKSADNGSYTAEGYFTYNKSYKEHNFEALAGYAIQEYSGTSNTLTGLGFAGEEIPYLSAASSITGSSGYNAYRLLSTIGRLNYNYKGKYLLSAAIRRDGSSRFGANQQFGNFPSIAAGWIVSDENFMKNLKIVDFLKIRASYGLTGNNAFGNYDAQALVGNFYYDFNNQIVQGSTINSLANIDLKWERTKQFDLGFELGIFKNRITINYDYYHKITDDLILPRPIPRASGFASTLYNVGEVEFWGHELSVSSTNTTGKLKWNTNFNISIDRNIINGLVDPGFIRRNSTVTSDYFRHQVGHSLGEFYGFEFLGLYKDAADLASSAKYLATAANPNGSSAIGTIKVKDINGDGVIDDVNDRTFIGDPTPTFTGGITNSFGYKNFDLSISMSFSVGGEILNAAKWAYQTNMDGSRLPLAAVADRWRGIENPGSGIYPRTLTNTTAIGRSVNSQWLEDGSYLAAKNIALGYRFNLKNNMALKNLRVYASVQNAFVLTKFSGLNPEINITGADPTLGIGINEEAYAVPRTFAIGISTTFK